MKAVYYPPKSSENYHPIVEVIGETKTGRVRIQWQDAEGEHKKTVMKSRVEFNQLALIEE